MACLTVVPARIAAASAAPRSRIRARASVKPAARSLSRRAERSVRVCATEDETEDAETEDIETMEARVSGAMQEFADAGFPSDEGDAQDPVSRTKAMNGAVEDLNTLMDAEVEVLGKAFDLLEQLESRAWRNPRNKGADAAEDPESVRASAEKRRRVLKKSGVVDVRANAGREQRIVRS